MISTLMPVYLDTAKQGGDEVDAHALASISSTKPVNLDTARQGGHEVGAHAFV